jgi:SWI/SNF-related matrix-associated actin-dependent regulator 1 of chromatin subfamily A
VPDPTLPTPTDLPEATPPSHEVLGEAARRVAEAYPSLYEHQRSGVAFLLSHRRAILADDMGLGKTRQAIIALREAQPEGPHLIVCPAGVKPTWAREIQIVEPGADVALVSGSDGPRANARWTVINYDLLGRHRKALSATPWAGLAIDEAHYIKNDSARTKHVLRLAGLGDSAHEPEVVYLLTGTPMTNRPRDLFNLLKAVRHPLATSFYSYAKRYCAAFDNGYGLDSRGASNMEELAQVVAGVMLRRTKDEALDLPPKMRTWQPVEIDSAQVRRAEATALQFFSDNPQRDGPAWATFLGKLNQARHALALAKVEATLEAVQERLEAGEKVVVFSSYTGVIERLREELGDQARVITGATPAAQRQAAADAFQEDPGVRVLLGNLVAAGVGLTLTAGTHVVFNDLDWVPANHWQAEDRIYRIGQTRPAFVTYLVAEGTLDDYVAALLEQKARLVGVLEAEAADRATIVNAVVEAAVSGERPDWGRLGVQQAERVAAAADGGSMGLLGDVLDLLARAGRGLGAISAEQVIEVPSRSRPGEVNIVRISAGVATCSCKGFSYRGDCSHAREAARQAAA